MTTDDLHTRAREAVRGPTVSALTDTVEILRAKASIEALTTDPAARQRAFDRAAIRAMHTSQSLRDALRQEARHIAEGIEP